MTNRLHIDCLFNNTNSYVLECKTNKFKLLFNAYRPSVSLNYKIHHIIGWYINNSSYPCAVVKIDNEYYWLGENSNKLIKFKHLSDIVWLEWQSETLKTSQPRDKEGFAASFLNVVNIAKNIEVATNFVLLNKQFLSTNQKIARNSYLKGLFEKYSSNAQSIGRTSEIDLLGMNGVCCIGTDINLNKQHLKMITSSVYGAWKPPSFVYDYNEGSNLENHLLQKIISIHPQINAHKFDKELGLTNQYLLLN